MAGYGCRVNGCANRLLAAIWQPQLAPLPRGTPPQGRPYLATPGGQGTRGALPAVFSLSSNRKRVLDAQGPRKRSISGNCHTFRRVQGAAKTGPIWQQGT